MQRPQVRCREAASGELQSWLGPARRSLAVRKKPSRPPRSPCSPRPPGWDPRSAGLAPPGRPASPGRPHPSSHRPRPMRSAPPPASRSRFAVSALTRPRPVAPAPPRSAQAPPCACSVGGAVGSLRGRSTASVFQRGLGLYAPVIRARAARAGMAAATEPGARAWLGGGSVRPSSPASSPVLGARGHARQGPGPGRSGLAAEPLAPPLRVTASGR